MGLLSLISAANNAAKKYASSAKKTTSSASSGGRNTSSNAKPVTTYNVTTKSGQDIAANLPAGQGFMNSDDHYWEKDANNGKIYVTSPSGNRLTLTVNDSVYTDPAFASGSGGYSANDVYERYLSEQQAVIDAKEAADKEAIRRQTQATIDSINANIPKINQDYENQQRANYITHEKAKAGMGDYLTAAGLNGGMAESTALGLQSNYQNLRNATDQEKNNALSELQNMVAQAQATGDTNLANLATQKYQSMLDAMRSARQSADSMAQWQQNMAMQNKQYADSQAQQAWENQFATDKFNYETGQAAITNALKQAKEARIASNTTGAKSQNSNSDVSSNSAVALTSSSMGYPQVLNTLGTARTAAEVKSAAQQLLAQGVSEEYVKKALSVLGY
jgi:hypothetical protein